MPKEVVCAKCRWSFEGRESVSIQLNVDWKRFHILMLIFAITIVVSPREAPPLTSLLRIYQATVSWIIVVLYTSIEQNTKQVKHIELQASNHNYYGPSKNRFNSGDIS